MEVVSVCPSERREVKYAGDKAGSANADHQTAVTQLPGTQPPQNQIDASVDRNIRRADLPEFINEYSEQLLRELVALGWNIKDVSHEVYDNFGDVKARFEHFDIEPDPRGSPSEKGAATLWQNDPEDFPHWGGRDE